MYMPRKYQNMSKNGQNKNVLNLKYVVQRLETTSNLIFLASPAQNPSRTSTDILKVCYSIQSYHTIGWANILQKVVKDTCNDSFPEHLSLSVMYELAL
jgi:hypothetical protein